MKPLRQHPNPRPDLPSLRAPTAVSCGLSRPVRCWKTRNLGRVAWRALHRAAYPGCAARFGWAIVIRSCPSRRSIASIPRQLLDMQIGYSSAEIVKLVSRSKSGSQRPAGKHADCKPPFHSRLRELQRRWMAPTDSGGENRPSPLRPRRARETACSSNNDGLSVSTIAQPTRAHTGTIAAIAMWFLRHWASK